MAAPILQVAAKAVIVDGAGRLLLVRESRKATNTQEGRYGTVGGRLQPGEGFFDALHREVKEETGLIVEPIALTGVYKNMSRGIIALVFRCRPNGGALTENSEVAGFRWIREADVSSIMSEAYAVRILDAYQHNAITSIRNHDGVRLVVPG